MNIIREGDIEISLPLGAKYWKFDDCSHGLSYCMKAVDYIIETPECVYLVEIKDPDDPASDPVRREGFIDELKRSQIDEILKYKYRDSFLYGWLNNCEWVNNINSVPIHFVVLLGVSALSSPELLVRTEELKRKLPLKGPRGTPFVRPFVSRCYVLNLTSWNKRMVGMPAKRLSEAGSI